QTGLQLETLGTQASRAGRRLNQTASSFNSLRAGAFSLRGALAGLGLGLFVREVIQVGLSFRQIEASMTASSVSSRIAADNFRFVREEALRLGLDIGQVGVEFARLAAASRGTSLTTQQTRDVF